MGLHFLILGKCGYLFQKYVYLSGTAFENAFTTLGFSVFPYVEITSFQLHFFTLLFYTWLINTHNLPPIIPKNRRK